MRRPSARLARELVTSTVEPAGAPFNGRQSSWAYDAIGNRTSQTVDGNRRTYSYLKNGTNPLNGQRLATVSTGISYQYDGAGNQQTPTVSGITTTYEDDNANLMDGIAGSVSAAYTYDVNGRRSGKNAGGTAASYLYDGQNLVKETTAAGSKYMLFGLDGVRA